MPFVFTKLKVSRGSQVSFFKECESISETSSVFFFVKKVKAFWRLQVSFFKECETILETPFSFFFENVKESLGPLVSFL